MADLPIDEGHAERGRTSGSEGAREGRRRRARAFDAKVIVRGLRPREVVGRNGCAVVLVATSARTGSQIGAISR